MILPAWFDHLQKRFSSEEVQLKELCVPLKTNCPPAVNVNVTLDNNKMHSFIW